MEKNNEAKTKSEKELALYYLRTFTGIAREPVLVLDFELKVVGANATFYNNFEVTKEQTENQFIYNIGNGQWDIPELRKLLEDILPEKKAFKDFEVTHDFPEIGPKTMLLNAMRLDTTQQIILAIEDITVKKALEEKLAEYTKNLEKGVAEKTAELKARVDELAKINKLMVGREIKMIELKKEINQLKKVNS
jgi:nitrogen-specific signal transduction histidine kinase